MFALWVLPLDAWLESYDPDAGDPAVAYPTGHFTTTPHAELALHFPDTGSAVMFWMQTSTRTPVRPDGKPNRPLTRFTVEVRAVADSSTRHVIAWGDEWGKAN